MEAALYDPEFGYYTRGDLKRWGREGDYRTSAERSELFAATFARYFIKLYHELGRPWEWTIVECGAGDGRFAQRVLTVLSAQSPTLLDATHYVLHDVSENSRSRARQVLHEFEDSVSYELPETLETGIYFSNELLDAFPVHRLTSEGELYVTLNSDNDFICTTGPFSTPRLAEFLDEHTIELAPGQTIEVNLAIDDWLTSVAAKLNRGYVITVDYGAEAADLYDPYLRPDGTLRAFSKHGFVDDVLTEPGVYDITSSVNWTQVIKTGERLGLEVVEFSQQDRFLLKAGLVEVLAERLKRIEKQADQVRLTTDAREMILPGGMASSFQVLVQRRK
jgi:SAM-dependent MidA family methyltransferase